MKRATTQSFSKSCSTECANLRRARAPAPSPPCGSAPPPCAADNVNLFGFFCTPLCPLWLRFLRDAGSLQSHLESPRMRPVFHWNLGSRSLELGKRTLIMGVVNVTSDSFSDGGQFLDRDQAVDHAQR